MLIRNIREQHGFNEDPPTSTPALSGLRGKLERALERSVFSYPLSKFLPPHILSTDFLATCTIQKPTFCSSLYKTQMTTHMQWTSSLH